MAATIAPLVLSGSTDGIGVTIAGTSTGTADTIHTASATANVIDEIWLWVHNTHTTDVELTLEWGNSTRPLKFTVPFTDGAYVVVPGWRLENSKTVKAFADVTNVLMVIGNVNRYTP